MWEMKSFAMFLLGVAAGVAGTLAFQALEEHVDARGQESLADKLQENLDALEERLASVHMYPEASA